MSQTKNALDVPQQWTSLNELASLSIGTDMVIQNVGIPGDVISVAHSISIPDDDFLGVALNQFNPMMLIEDPDFTIWIRFYRFDKLDAYPSRQGIIQVQELDGSIRQHFNVGSVFGSGSSSNELNNSILFTLQSIECQLKLLNERTEEAYETGLGETDV